MAFQNPPAFSTYLVPTVLNRTTLATLPPLFSMAAQDARLVTFDCSAALANGGTITGTPTITVSSSTATAGTVFKNGTNTQFQALISGGTAGDTAEVIGKAVDSEGQTITGAFFLAILANT